MVRLKDLRWTQETDSDYLFQFHNGSIKSSGFAPQPQSESVFQFHNGSIKSKSYALSPDVDRYVSIPQWFD